MDAAAALEALAISGRYLTVRFAGAEHEVELVEGDREQEAALYFCGAAAARWRYVSGPRDGEQITPAAVIDALECVDEDDLLRAIDDLAEADRRDRAAKPIVLAFAMPEAA